MSAAAFLLQMRPGRVEATPSILLAVSPTSTSIQQNGSTVDLTVTLTRNNFVEDVTLSVTGLPTNVTATYPSGQSFTSGATSRTIRLTAASNAQLVTAQVATITATGVGVINATTQFSLTVTSSIPASINLGITPSSANVTQNNTTDYTVTLTRVGGYTNTVTIATTGLPTGVTASYPSGNTFTGGTTTRTLRLSAASDAPTVNNDSFSVTGSGVGVANSVANATVSVTADAGLEGLWLGNIPSGMTLFRDTQFTGGVVSGVPNDGLQCNSTPNNANVNGTDAAAPFGPNCFRFTYPQGSLGGGSGTFGDQLYASSGTYSGKRLYIAFYVYYSTNYEVHTNTGTEKFAYPTTATGTNPSIGVNRAVSNTQIGLSIIPQSDGSVGQANQTVGPFIQRGQWHLVEMLLTMNTPGNNDARLDYWLDGALAWSRTNLKYVNGSTDGNFSGNRVLDSTRGGGNSSIAVPTGGMWRQFSRVAVYTSATRS